MTIGELTLICLELVAKGSKDQDVRIDITDGPEMTYSAVTGHSTPYNYDDKPGLIIETNTKAIY